MNNETRPGFNPLDSETGDTAEELARLKAFNEDWVSRRRYDSPKIDRPNAIRIMNEHGLTAGQQEAWLAKFDADNLERAGQVERMRQDQAPVQDEEGIDQEILSDEETARQTEEARLYLEKIAQQERQQAMARQQHIAEEKRPAGKLPGQENPVQIFSAEEHAQFLKEVEERNKELEQAKKPGGVKGLIKRLGELLGR